MTKFVVAVSGGVDSVVLLHMLANQSDRELIVAHFDHGIRDDSHLDAELVLDLAKKYNLQFETRREELGKKASEELARDRRYEFLREIAKKYDAQIITAHHADDVIESIAINLSRGTGWRGLAVLDSDITRPLTSFTKSEILDYAKKHKLTWRDDITNSTDKYLRNRIRQKTDKLLNDKKRQLLALWAGQKSTKKMINEEVKRIIGNGPNYSRHFFIHIEESVGLECLRYITNAQLTRPQMVKVLHKIKTSLPKKSYQAGGGIKIDFTSRNFTVELIK